MNFTSKQADLIMYVILWLAGWGLGSLLFDIAALVMVAARAL